MMGMIIWPPGQSIPRLFPLRTYLVILWALINTDTILLNTDIILLNTDTKPNHSRQSVSVQ